MSTNAEMSSYMPWCKKTVDMQAYILSQTLVYFLARLFEEKELSYCRHSGVSVWVG